MRITTKGRYGIRAVVALAASQDDRPLAISRIAKDEGVSPEFLEQIFFRLKKSGLIRSLRGPHGGFLLNRDAAKISVFEILAAVDESVAPAPCTVVETERPCPRVDQCPAYPMWQELSDLISGYLTHVTVKDLLERKESYFPSMYAALERGSKVPASRA